MDELLCDARLPEWTAGQWRSICALPATAVHRYGCQHGHIVERPTCDEHARKPGIVGCRACFDTGHECPMTAELVQTLP